MLNDDNKNILCYDLVRDGNMNANELLIKLKEMSENLSNIGDVSKFTKEEFLKFVDQWADLCDIYDEIMHSADFFTMVDALDVVDNIVTNNPSLYGYVEDLINPKETDKSIEENNNLGNAFNPNVLTQKIDNLVFELKNGRVWDSERIVQIESTLRQYSEELEIYKSSFSPEEFNRLQTNIRVTIEHINRVSDIGRSI